MSGKARKTLLACGCGAALAAGALWALRQTARPRLPALTRHERLPPAFDEDLRRSREAAESSGDPDAFRRVASLYEANRLFAEARASFRVVASRAGGLAARDHYLLAAMDLDENDAEGAKAELGEVLKAEPGYVPARLRLAELLFKTGNTDDAVRLYEAVAAADPGNPQASFGLARARLQEGKDEAAIALLRSAVARHPDSSSSEALLSQIMDRRGETEQAAALRELSQEAHDPVPPDPWLRPLLTECYDVQRLGIAFEQYRLSGQIGEALPLLDRLEQLDPSGWMPHMLRGWSLKEAGDDAGAVREFRTALERGGDPETLCPLAVAALLRSGNPKAAADLLADYHARLPRSVPILKSYCEVAVRSGETALARRLLAEVLALDPYLYMANMSLVQILWTSGEREEAAKILERVARVYPADIDSRSILGQYYIGKGDPAPAVAPLEQAMTLIGGSPDKRREHVAALLEAAYLLAGSVEGANGRLAAAAGYADKAIALNPGEPRGYALKANASRRMGDFAGAARAIEGWIALKPGEPAMEMSLGDLRFQAGDRERARQAWQEALRAAPSEARELRAALEGRLSGRIVPR